MESSETLREALFGMQREIDLLRTEKAHAVLLLNALEALLRVDDGDPFAGVFAALRTVFDFSQAIVLVERDGDDEGLEGVVAEPAELASTQWTLGRFFRKILAGRVAATFSNRELEEWATQADRRLSADQPALYLPIRVRERRGLMMMLRPAGEPGFCRDHVALARKFALLASHAFAARHAHQGEAERQRLRSLTRRLQESQTALAHRANHDQLTELPNRSFMQELMEAALAQGSGEHGLALAFIDLDDFKQVNDFYSHSVGDALLRGVAARLRSCVREGDVVGRISGDEFLILFRSFRSVDELRAMADGIVAQLKLPFVVEGYEILTSASIGIALSPEHGTDYEVLRRNADIAMYKAKTASKGGAAYFDDTMGDAAAARFSLEQRLRDAVKRGQFRCAFQPKVNLRTMRVVGFEALARWVDASGTVHPPASFIEAAGDLGLLNDIAELILDDVIASLPLLDESFGRDTRVGLNISARQASDPVFMAAFAARLEASSQAGRFVLEVTEDAFVSTSIFQTQVLPLLRSIGVSVSIDDFGTGYSSLSALADITADELKVDRSFISSIHQRQRSQSILKAVESLARALGMSVVAEGVETEAELDYLLSRTSIGMAQGFLFSRPQFAEDLVRSMRERTGGPMLALPRGLLRDKTRGMGAARA